MNLRSKVLLGFLLAVLIGNSASGVIPDLNGSWVMVQVYPRIAVLPLVGESFQTSYVVQRVVIEQDDDMLTMTDSYCFTFIEDSSLLATTEIPATFMEALRPDSREATLSDSNGEITFIQQRYTEVRGAILGDMVADTLPIDPDDSRVLDQDEDGFPGMTVNVNILGFIEAQIYVVQRVQYALSGSVISSDRIEGAIEWSDEQIVLAATNPLLMADSTGYPDPDPSRHRFVMIRAHEAWTCEWLAEYWREVFGLE